MKTDIFQARHMRTYRLICVQIDAGIAPKQRVELTLTTWECLRLSAWLFLRPLGV